MSRPPRGRRRRGGAGKARPASRPPEVVVIDKLAARGDGEARLADGTRAFVPFTLPGDRVRVEIGAARSDGVACRAVEFLESRPRAEPICPVFGRCGGCQLQHAPAPLYAEWKRDVVAECLRRAGVDAPLAPLERVPVASRRRADFAAVRAGGAVLLGFHEGESDRVVGIDGCPLLVPALDGLIGPLGRLLAAILRTAGDKADVSVTAADGNAVDMLISASVEPGLAEREALAVFAREHGVARIGWRTGNVAPEPVLVREEPCVRIGEAIVALPMGSFLQPSQAGEEILRRLVRAGVGDAGRIADLYCGVGTFALDLAGRGASVLAVDGAAEQVQALSLAAGRAGLGGRVTTEIRDLRTRPVEAAGLAGMDAVVFDPPRAGARAQAAEIAASDVGRCVAVSCNPATLARDLRVLVDGGFRVEGVTPLDQFPYSRHVEAVATLSR